jgi:outer membrane protein TolC
MLQGLSLTLPLAGCLLTGDKPEPGLDIPPAYSAGPRNPVAAEAAMPPLDWWRSFRSRELTELIEEARSSNLDIAVAVAQIVQADAQARIAGAALLPIIDFNANGQHSQQSKTTGSSSLINISRSGPSVAIINNNLSATLNASYEIDFWGAITGRWSGSRPLRALPTPIFRSLQHRIVCASRVKTWQARIASLI